MCPYMSRTRSCLSCPYGRPQQDQLPFGSHVVIRHSTDSKPTPHFMQGFIGVASAAVVLFWCLFHGGRLLCTRVLQKRIKLE